MLTNLGLGRSAMTFLATLFIRVVVFGIVIAFVTRRNDKVTVTPRAALPVVALVFAGLNTVLYGVLKTTLNIGTLFMLALAVPFIANAILLWLTDRLIKPFKVDGLAALAYASFMVTLAHILLRLLHL
jgi:uncharacterized membrane protein YvlD (DUF360 family)